MNETRLEKTRAKSPWNDGWPGALMGLVLIAGAILSVGSAPKPAAANASKAAISAAASTPAALADADRDVLDLQLD
jgi:hypothetical protein